MKIVNPPELPPARGYNHGVIAEGTRFLFVAGQTGLPEQGEPGDFAAQFGLALRRVRVVVEAAGGAVEHVSRLTIYVTDMPAYLAAREILAPIYREVFGSHFPAMSAVAVAGLVFPDALVEIEATAVLP